MAWRCKPQPARCEPIHACDCGVLRAGTNEVRMVFWMHAATSGPVTVCVTFDGRIASDGHHI